MTIDEIRATILASPELRAHVAAGDDQSLADALADILPRIPTRELMTERSLFAKLGPIVADTILSKLEAFSTTGMPGASVMARGLKWLVPQAGGVDFQHPALLALLEGLVAANTLTQEEFIALSELGTERQTLNLSQIAEIVAPWRLDGVVQPIPEEA
jgi:hypothetical protein